jgi:hypothetical protein
MDTACICLEESHARPYQPQNVLCIGSTPFPLLDIGHYSHAGRGPRPGSARSDEAGLANGGVCGLKQDGIPKF